MLQPAVVMLGSALLIAPQANCQTLSPRSFRVDDSDRTALLYLPPQAQHEPCPLVLVFHGHGGSSAAAARSFRLHEAWPTDQPTQLPEDPSSFRRLPAPSSVSTFSEQHHLPREVHTISLPEADRMCPCCNEPMHKIGEECSERLDYAPTVLKVIETRREKYACRKHEESGVLTPPAPVHPIEKGMATAGLLAHVLVAK